MDHKKATGDTRTAIVLGTCALLGNYCFVAFVYVTSQLEENAYAMKFWIKSLVRFPLSSTLGFALVFVPSLILVAIFAPPRLSRLKPRYTRIATFAACTLITYFILATAMQLLLYQRLSWNVQNLVLLTMLLCVGAGVAMVTAPRDK